MLIDLYHCCLPLGIEFGDEGGFINLQPLDTGAPQGVDQVFIGIDNSRQQVEFVAAIFALTQVKVSQRTNNHRFNRQLLGLSFINLLDERFRIGCERRLCVELRHDVVVVGIKPLGHFSGTHTAAFPLIGRTPPGNTKVIVQGIAGQVVHTGGNMAKHKTGIQYLVVERKITHGYKIECGLLLPMGLAQFRRHFK